MKLTEKIICRIEEALALIEYGEIILIVHAGQIAGIDMKTRHRLVDKSTQPDINSHS